MTENEFQRFEEWQLQGLQLDVITYIAVISASRKYQITDTSVMVERTLQLLVMRLQGLQPVVITYTALTVLAGSANWQRVPCSSFRLPQGPQ